MVCAVPLFAVVYALLKKAGNAKLAKRGLSEDPAAYEHLAYIDDETGEHVLKELPVREKKSRRKKADDKTDE